MLTKKSLRPLLLSAFFLFGLGFLSGYFLKHSLDDISGESETVRLGPADSPPKPSQGPILSPRQQRAPAREHRQEKAGQAAGKMKKARRNWKKRLLAGKKSWQTSRRSSPATTRTRSMKYWKSWPIPAVTR